MSAPAWFPFHVGDYLKDTRRLTLEEHGAYLLLILEYWQSGGLPDDDGQLARIVGVGEKKWQVLKKNLVPFFGANWRHKRIDQELFKAKTLMNSRSVAGEKGAKARWEAKGNRMGEAITSALANALQKQ